MPHRAVLPSSLPLHRLGSYTFLLLLLVVFFYHCPSVKPGLYDGLKSITQKPITTTNGNVTHLTPHAFHALSKRVRVTYGPYLVPGSNGAAEGVGTFVEQAATKPCADCVVTYMRAGLQFPDGRPADVLTGMQLRRVTLGDTSVPDTVCPELRSGDGDDDVAPRPNRFFTSSDERQAVDLSLGGTAKAGYFLAAHAALVATTTLVNADRSPRDAVLTLEYEFVERTHRALPVPQAFEHVRTAWLDTAGCEGGGGGGGGGGISADDHVTKQSAAPGGEGGQSAKWRVPTAWRDRVVHAVVAPHMSSRDGTARLEVLRTGGDGGDDGDDGSALCECRNDEGAAVAARGEERSTLCKCPSADVNPGDELSVVTRRNATTTTDGGGGGGGGERQELEGSALLYIVKGRAQLKRAF